MPTFVTIGYGDEAGYERTPQTVLDAAHAHDTQLVEDGVVVGRAGTPVQVRNPEGRGVATTTGPFLRSELPLAGFAIVEAESLDAAVAMVAQSPCAVAHGVVEVWPLE
jgi:hypothetical protein